MKLTGMLAAGVVVLVLSSLQGAFAARNLQQAPGLNAALNQQLQGAINQASPLVNSFAQTVSSGLRNFNYSSIDWEKLANRVNSGANETLTKILPQPNVTAINEAAEKPFIEMNRTVVEEFPKFYDNFHWERPTMLNQTLNQLPLKEVVDQAINDQEPLLERPEFYHTVSTLPVRPIFADGAGVASFAQVRRHASHAPAPAPEAVLDAPTDAPAPAPLDAVSAAVGTVLEGLNALAQGSPVAAPVAAAFEQVAAAAAAPARAGAAQIVGPIGTLLNTLTAGTPLASALNQARSAVAATPVGAVVSGAQTAVTAAVANSPIAAVVEGARTTAGPAIQNAQALAGAPVSSIIQNAGSAIAGAPMAGPLLQAVRSAAGAAAGPVAPLIENARAALAQAPVSALMQAARRAVASSPFAGIANAVQGVAGRLPTLPGGLPLTNFAQAPAPSDANPFANLINVTDVAQGFTQGLNRAINGGVPALMPSNPIDMVVRAINSNGGSATPVQSTTQQSFKETNGADGETSLIPMDEPTSSEPVEEAAQDEESAVDEEAATEAPADTMDAAAPAEDEETTEAAETTSTDAAAPEEETTEDEPQ